MESLSAEVAAGLVVAAWFRDVDSWDEASKNYLIAHAPVYGIVDENLSFLTDTIQNPPRWLFKYPAGTGSDFERYLMIIYTLANPPEDAARDSRPRALRPEQVLAAKAYEMGQSTRKLLWAAMHFAGDTKQSWVGTWQLADTILSFGTSTIPKDFDELSW